MGLRIGSIFFSLLLYSVEISTRNISSFLIGVIFFLIVMISKDVHIIFLLIRELMNQEPTASKYCFHQGLLCQLEDNTHYRPLEVYPQCVLNSMSLRGKTLQKWKTSLHRWMYQIILWINHMKLFSFSFWFRLSLTLIHKLCI